MRDTFIKRLTEIAASDSDVMLLTGDLGFAVLDNFSKQYPRQFLNVGVAEQNMTGVATGLALSGKKVFTYSIANFPVARCLEQIRNDAAYHDANVNVVSIGGGFGYGALGMSHHATEDIAMLRAMPITIVAPGDLWETEQAVQQVIDTPGVCYLRLDKANAGMTQQPGEIFQIGKARKLRDGDAITLVSTGGILNAVLAAADELASEGIHCRVLSMHTIKPLDQQAIAAAAKETGGIITVEEHAVDGGLGGAVAECCLEGGYVPQHFYRVGLRAGFSSVVGSQDYLRDYYHIGISAIVDRVKTLLGVINETAN